MRNKSCQVLASCVKNLSIIPSDFPFSVQQADGKTFPCVTPFHLMFGGVYRTSTPLQLHCTLLELITKPGISIHITCPTQHLRCCKCFLLSWVRIESCKSTLILASGLYTETQDTWTKLYGVLRHWKWDTQYYCLSADVALLFGLSECSRLWIPDVGQNIHQAPEMLGRLHFLNISRSKYSMEHSPRKPALGDLAWVAGVEP